MSPERAQAVHAFPDTIYLRRQGSKEVQPTQAPHAVNQPAIMVGESPAV